VTLPINTKSADNQSQVRSAIGALDPVEFFRQKKKAPLRRGQVEGYLRLRPFCSGQTLSFSLSKIAADALLLDSIRGASALGYVQSRLTYVMAFAD
jgi:hypothetical protein